VGGFALKISSELKRRRRSFIAPLVASVAITDGVKLILFVYNVKALGGGFKPMLKQTRGLALG
jgi:hypothetical protein